MPAEERKALAIRFAGQSKITVTLKSQNGCGHNFLFAAKACLTGHCDPCAGASTCVFTGWEEWSGCTERCEGGSQSRKRGVAQGVMTSHGGGCDGALSWVRSCNTQSCDQNCEPQSCVWGAWGEWEVCDKCGGQRKRTRRIQQLPDCGGAACKAGAETEIGKCPRRCHDQPFCLWSDWTAFGQCSVTCGCGRKHRTRILKQVDTLPGLSQQYELNDKLQQEVEILKTNRQKNLLGAFIAGPAVMALAFVAFKLSRQAQRQDEVQDDSRVEGGIELRERTRLLLTSTNDP